MKYARILAASLLAAALFAAGGISTASAQGDLLTPPAVRDGSASGEVVVSWPAIPGANFYRIGWVARQDLDVVTSAGRDWKDAFVFVDVANLGQTSYTVPRLQPGGLHHFIMGSVDERFGSARWSDWATFTPNPNLPACPAAPQPQPEPQPAPTGSAAGDRDALIALYNSTSGANWANNRNWGTNTSLSLWEGVFTNADGRVTNLQMESAGLSGQLPAELGNLSALTYLLLRGNQLTGPIPTQLGNLSNLDFLDMGHNQLTGPIPASLGNLSKLTNIYLAQNQLTGIIPEELGNLTQLDSLNLDHNQLTGPIPSSLGNLTILRLLFLGDNGLTGQIPPYLGDLSELGWLNLARNQLSGSIPTALGNLDNLRTLHLSGNNFSGCIPAGLQDVPNNDFNLVDMEICEN